ncbi:MAG: hypothetical protein OXI81_16455 [Paracoccaceae bacterium]|nr:hypothetical protein [Paracoccaceae bacterium]
MGTAVVAAQTSIVSISVASFAEELNAEWRASGRVLEDAAIVDARRLGLVFGVDHGSRWPEAVGGELPIAPCRCCP